MALLDVASLLLAVCPYIAAMGEVDISTLEALCSDSPQDYGVPTGGAHSDVAVSLPQHHEVHHQEKNRTMGSTVIASGPTWIDKEGVSQTIYVNYIKHELHKEASCLELPFTILLLCSFAVLALAHLGQENITIMETAITTDIVENANFAWAHNFGHKGLHDVNSVADFWSFFRLGLVPLLTMSWGYSEGLPDAVPDLRGDGVHNTSYDVGALPSQRHFPGQLEAVPVRSDYLRYNRIIGGFRLRQGVREPRQDLCVLPGGRGAFQTWWDKPCTGLTIHELPPDMYAASTFENVSRVEWFFTDTEGSQEMQEHAVDMEDGCASARAQQRPCRCSTCLARKPGGDDGPWLDELTERVEISFLVYNAQYGLYCMAGVNLWFNRAGQIHKLVDVRSAWASMWLRPSDTVLVMIIADAIWLLCLLYTLRVEGIEIISLVYKRRGTPWYIVIAEDYVGFWTLVDWLSVVVAFIIIFSYWSTTNLTGTLNSSLGAVAEGHPLNPRAIYQQADEMYQEEKSMRMWLSLYPLVIMMRLFKSFSAQPRLAVVTQTFVVAQEDLFHFIIVFASVYVCMVVNSLIFFGQDSLDFATFDRAFHSCFRALLGDWDWEDMLGIDMWKAFFWFFLFMMVMVLILLNMLLAIIMESYGHVAAKASEAVSVFRQGSEIYRRWKQSRRKERVRLNDIWDAMMKEQGVSEVEFLASKQKVFPDYLQDVVPGIPKAQAVRTLNNAQCSFDAEHDEEWSVQKLQPQMNAILNRVDCSLKCAAWTSTKLTLHEKVEVANQKRDKQRKKDKRALGPGASVLDLANAELTSEWSKTEEDEVDEDAAEKKLREAEEAEALDALQHTASERITEMQGGIASVVKEEMKTYERRQSEQETAMRQMQEAVGGLDRLVERLCQTCDDLVRLARSAGFLDMARQVSPSMDAESSQIHAGDRGYQRIEDESPMRREASPVYKE